MRVLQQTGYISEVSVKSTKAGFEATEYELTAKTFLALMLDSINLEDLLNQTTDVSAREILAAIAALKYLGE